MLYITTRSCGDTYTSHKALTSDFAPDGGRFIPFRIPRYTQAEIVGLKETSFNKTIADILNLFFSCRIEAFDVDFCIGKCPARLLSMSHRIVVSELWHNPEAKLSYIVDHLYARICDCLAVAPAPTEWFRIAVIIAMLFGIYGEMLRNEYINETEEFDISVPADDFQAPIAAWYAHKMGLPINVIISCACGEENSNIWDLIHRGIINTGAASDSFLFGLERLIHATLGPAEVQRFLEACQKRQVYSVNEEMLSVLNHGFFCAVAGKNRAESTINSVFRTNTYVIDPLTALCYSGLQDYRASTGSGRITLLLAQQTPMDFAHEVSAATGIAEQALIDLVKF